MTHFSIGSKLSAFVLLGVFASSGAIAAEPKIERRTAVLQNVLDCKSKTDAAERLACYDAAVSSLGAAEQKGDIVVVDREQAQAARRQAFGFAMPSLDIFNRTDTTPEQADRLETVATNAYRGGDGKWVFELEGGAVWSLYDAVTLGRTPKAGSKVEIRRGGVGGFFLRSDGQAGVRAKRIR